MPAAGAAVAEYSIGGTPVLKPVARPLAAGAWTAGGMPFCFPFAGRVWHEGKTGRYQPARTAEGNTVVEMPIHGFNSRLIWNVVSRTESSVTLDVEDTPETRAIYPWKFRARMEYRLQDESGIGLHTVVSVNCDGILPEAEGRPMPLAPGFHPYFAAKHPGDKTDGAFSFAYDQVLIPALETVAVTAEGNAGARKLAADFFGNAGKSGKDGITIPLHDERIYNLIFSGLSGREARLGKLAISWSKDSPWRKIVCWAKPTEHFFCLEPWYGLPDAVNRPRGTVDLAMGQSAKFDVRISMRP
jgi:galactose mutarotase-like enzyme